jgi:hypothetical protein
MLSAATAGPPRALARTKAPCSTAWVCSARLSAVQPGSRMPCASIASAMSRARTAAWPVIDASQASRIAGAVP